MRNLLLICLLLLSTILINTQPADAAPQSSPTRIYFSAGATDYFSPDNILATNAVHEFVIGAAANQHLLAVITTTSLITRNNFAFEIRGLRDGIVLVFDNERMPTWSGRLPSTQDYLIRIINHGPTETYSLMIQIPINIQFNWGATQATYIGDFQTAISQDYVLRAQAGQWMTVYLSTTHPEMTIWAIGDDGTFLQIPHETQSFRVQLPTTQDYIIGVIRNNTNGGRDYALTVIIPPLYGYCQYCNG
jgi:hypothetical protein